MESAVADEIWASVEEAPGYQVSNLGRVMGRRGKPLTLVVNQFGYQTVTPYVNGKTIYRQVHRLVAQAFIPNPDELPLVNHKDGSRLNNRASNLEWVTAKQNAEKVVRPTQSSKRRSRAVVEMKLDETTHVWPSVAAAAEAAGISTNSMSRWCGMGGYTVRGGSRWLYKEDHETPPDDEEWKSVTPGEGKARIEVSSRGRIRTSAGQICVGRLRGRYLHHQKYGVHRLVAMAFCPKLPGCDVVNHKDGNPQNNLALNLEWTTQRENSVHAHVTGLCRRRPVRRFLRDGTTRDYVSIQEASRQTKVSAGDIVGACKGTKARAGCTRWECIDEKPGDKEAPKATESIGDVTSRTVIEEYYTLDETTSSAEDTTPQNTVLSDQDIDELLNL